MDDRIYLIDLYDYYGDLLTDKQREYFEYYYFDNLSLSEISDNIKVSRNAIYNSLKEASGKLLYFESKLELNAKGMRIKKLIVSLPKDVQDEIKELI